jgi:hypothetical protein
MNSQTATGEIFIYSGLFGRFRMKPQDRGNKSFIHLARKYRFRMKPQSATGEIFIHFGLFGRVWGTPHFSQLLRKQSSCCDP